MRVTAKNLQAAAASVAGARAMGIETAASAAAPALLREAEAVLARLQDRADEADEVQSLDYGRLADQYRALAGAVDELRAALGLEPRDAIHAREAEALRVELQKEREAEVARVQARAEEDAARLRAEFERLWDAAPAGKYLDAAGEPMRRVRLAYGRAINGGWTSLGWQDATQFEDDQYAICRRDGTQPLPGEWYLIFAYDEWVEARDGLKAGAYGQVPRTSATSNWLPVELGAPHYQSDLDAESVFRECMRKPAAKINADPYENSPFAALAALKKSK